MTWIQTRTGAVFDFEDMGSSPVRPDDVAWSIAHQCRFNGHTRVFYSVAEHSIEMLRLAQKHGYAERHGPALELAILVHDAHEAYVGDVPRPIKGMLGKAWADFESACERCVRDRLGAGEIDDAVWELVSRLDKSMLRIEASELMHWPDRAWVFGPQLPITGGVIGAGSDAPEKVARQWLRAYECARVDYRKAKGGTG